MKYSELGEARILKPAKRSVEQNRFAGKSGSNNEWISLGDALVRYLHEGPVATLQQVAE